MESTQLELVICLQVVNTIDSEYIRGQDRNRYCAYTLSL